MLLADRIAAGRSLIGPIAALRGGDALVLGLPRGGVPVAHALARGLGLELGIVLVRKVGVPGHRELAVAALAGPEGEVLEVNRDIARDEGLDRAQIEALAAPERAELRRRRALWLGGRALPAVAGRTVVLVDDGLATGATMRAALAWIRTQAPARVIVAVPVGAPDALAVLEALADAVICPLRPQPFIAVGAHYRQFDQTDDAEVTRLLAEPGTAPDTEPGTEPDTVSGP